MSTTFDKIMRRTLGNLEVLHDRLLSMGYRFSHPESVLLSPSPAVEGEIRFLEAHIGEVPLALTTFYRVVGSVDFTGAHPEWEGCEYPDPIVVYPVSDAVSEAKEYLELKAPEEEYWAYESGILRILIADDYYCKENVCGGWWCEEVSGDRSV